MTTRSGAPLTAGLVLLVLVGSLVVYKTVGAVRQLDVARAGESLALSADVVSAASPALYVRIAARSVNYLAVIWPALVFGLLISAAVRQFVPFRAIAGLFGGPPIRGQLIAGASGTPLMLCSCCAAPVFSAVYERSRHLGPSLALLLAAPALNPAALALTFLLFPSGVAWGRLCMSVVAVFLGTAIVARLAPGAPIRLQLPTGEQERAAGSAVAGFLWSSLHVTARTVPVVLVGVAAAMLFAEHVQGERELSPDLRLWAVAVTAAVAVPLALPTFFEIPLAITLLAAGAPPGAAAALLFAGPAVNLASLLTVGREAGWKPVWMLAVMVWVVALVGGLMIG